MNICKKYISALLAMAIVLAQCNFVYADNSASVTSNSFDNYATYDIPSDININAEGYYIDEYADGKKGLLIHSPSRAATVQFGASCGEDFVFSFEIASAPTGFDGYLSLSDGSSEIKILNFLKDDKSIRLFDNYKPGKYAADKTTKIDVAVHTSSKTFDVYLNGKKLVADWYISDMKITGLSKAKLSVFSDDADGDVIIDNINSHDGTFPKKEYASAAYNPQILDKPAFEEAIVGNRVITSVDFEDGTMPFITEDYSNYFKLMRDENDNGILSVEKTEERRCLFASSINQGEMDRIIVEYKIKLLEQNTDIQLAIFKSVEENWALNVDVTSGTMKARNGSKSYKLPLYMWTKLSFAFSLSGKYFDIYINDELFESGVQWGGSFDDDISEIRLEVPRTDGYVTPGKFYVDDYQVYEGVTPREISDDEKLSFPEETIFPSERDIERLMQDRVGLHLKTGVVYADGNRFECDVPPYIENDYTMIPVRAVAEAFDLDVEYNPDDETVTIDDRIKMTIGSKSMTVDGVTIETNLAPEVRSDRTFLPLRDLCEKALGKSVYYNDSIVNGGMIVIGDTEFTPPAGNDLNRLNNFLMFLRPDADYLVQKHTENGWQGVHPRLLIDSSDVARLKVEVIENDIKAQWYKELVEVCENYKGTPPPVYGTYDGKRMSSAPLQTASLMALLYQLTGDSSWFDSAWPYIDAYCGFVDWNCDREFLNTAEISFYMGLCYDWFYEALSPEQRIEIEEAIHEKCIIESKKWWYGIKGPKDMWCLSDSNWGSVCQSGISVGALSVIEIYPEEAGEIISLCAMGFEYLADKFAPDGAWHEGTGYWELTFKYFARYLSIFEKIYGTNFGIDKFDGLNKAGDSLLYMQSDYGTFNFNDADVEKIYPEALYYLSNHFNNPSLTSITLQKSNFKTQTQMTLPYAIIWYDTSISPDAASITLPYDSTFYGETTFTVMRDSWTDPNGTYVGIKGGKTVLGHGDMDLGSFIYEINGERWAIDLGKDNYNLPFYADFIQKRWYVYRKRAEGHNTIVIDPDETGMNHNTNAFADVIYHASSESGAISVVDMSEVLSKNASAAKRGFFLTDDRKSLVVRDEITLNAPTDNLYWFMHTQATDASIDGNSVMLNSNGKRLKVDFTSNSDFEIMFMDAKGLPGTPTVEGENANAGIKKLALKVSGKGKVNITAKLSPIDVMTTDISEYDIPIDDWKLSDKPINNEKYLPDAIYYGDKKCENYSENDRFIVVNYVDGYSKLEEVKAESDTYKVEVIQPESFDDYAVIKVYGNETNYTQYIVSFNKVPAPKQFEGFESIPVFNVEASDVPQPLNGKDNVLDGNLDSRWSADASASLDGYVWLNLDLYEIRDFDTIMLSENNGNERTMKFSVEVSEDGKDYREVYNGVTSGTTRELENFDLGNCSGRYVKIKFYGTSEGNWCSPTEIVIAGKKGD